MIIVGKFMSHLEGVFMSELKDIEPHMAICFPHVQLEMGRPYLRRILSQNQIGLPLKFNASSPLKTRTGNPWK